MMDPHEFDTMTKTDLISLINGLITTYGKEAESHVKSSIAAIMSVKRDMKRNSIVLSSHNSDANQNSAKGGSSNASTTEAQATNESSNADAPTPSVKKKGDSSGFVMSNYRLRHIALQLQYDGEPFFGFAAQAGDAEETVEKHLFAALEKVKLIENRASSNYSRCGRTDSGVSAFGQVVALNLRSAFPKDSRQIKGASSGGGATAAADGEVALPQHPCDSLVCSKMVKVKKNPPAKRGKGGKSGENKAVDAATDASDTLREIEETVTEIDYCSILNRVLPNSIRIVAWKEVTPGFSARFSAGGRTYRYFFIRKKTIFHGSAAGSGEGAGRGAGASGAARIPGGNGTTCHRYNLDVDRMNTAAQYLVGDHDFRNFCKMDVSQVSNFRREVYSAQVKCFAKGSEFVARHEVQQQQQQQQQQRTMMDDCDEAGSASDNAAELVSGGISESDDVYMLEISGLAFLWHMVRCVMAVLFSVGYGVEEPEIVEQLLDFEGKKCKLYSNGKPTYSFAPEQPLVLHHCQYDHLNFDAHSPRVLWNLLSHYNILYEYHVLAAMRAKNAALQLQSDSTVVRVGDVNSYLQHILRGSSACSGAMSMKGMKTNGHPMMNRNTSSSLSPAAKRMKFEEGAGSSSSCSDNPISLEEYVGYKSSVECTSGNDSIPFHQFVRYLRLVHRIVPQNAHTVASCNIIPANVDSYIPLALRPRNDTYEQQVEKASGMKEQRMKRHLELRGTGRDNEPDFFHIMRAQGAQDTVGGGTGTVQQSSGNS